MDIPETHSFQSRCPHRLLVGVTVLGTDGLVLETDWKQIGNKLETNWKRIGNEVETNWRARSGIKLVQRFYQLRHKTIYTKELKEIVQ